MILWGISQYDPQRVCNGFGHTEMNNYLNMIMRAKQTNMSHN